MRFSSSVTVTTQIDFSRLEINLHEIATDNFEIYILCVSADLPLKGTTHHLLGASENQSSVISVPASTQYHDQLVSTCNKLVVSSKGQKVTFSSGSSRRMAFWQSLAWI